MSEVKRWTKRPVTIEAEQYTEENSTPRGLCTYPPCEVGAHVHTIHGDQRVDIVFGDWIIPEPDGHHYYPVKPDIFTATYEPATTEKGEEAL